MTFQAYLDSIKAKTGKTPDDFIKLAKEKGLTTHAELMAWLKGDFGLGHGHANAIAHLVRQSDAPPVSKDEKIDRHFTGAKAGWRGAYDALVERVKTFGSDVGVGPTNSYISLLRDGKKFAIVQVTGKRMDIGLKMASAAAGGRLEESGSWNAMVTHRVRIDEPAQIDDELYGWLRQAYESA